MHAKRQSSSETTHVVQATIVTYVNLTSPTLF
jgi:hypothetical protein